MLHITNAFIERKCAVLRCSLHHKRKHTHSKSCQF